MKRAFVLFALILVLSAIGFSQRNGRQLSADDQSRFDSYFQRWQNYQRTNNQGDSHSMENRMQSIYQRYGIRPDTPYRDVASNGNPGGNLDRDWSREQDRDRQWDQNRRADWDRYRDRDRSYWQQNQHLSGEDQGRFDSYFQRWVDYRRSNNRAEVTSMERRMFDVYDHYAIPHSVRFERVASQGGRY